MRTLAATLALALISGCGEGQGSNHEVQVSSGIVSTQIGLAYTATQSLSIDVGDHGGIAAARALGGIGVNATALLLLPKHEPSGHTELESYSFARELQVNDPPEGCKCTKSSCTFTNCVTAGGLKIDGELSWTDTTMKGNYKIHLQGSESSKTHLVHTVSCDLEYSKNHLSGVFSTKGSSKGEYEGQSYHSEWDVQVKIKRAEWSDRGKLIAPEVEVDATVDLHHKGESLHGSETVVLGAEDK